jgi:hypothetical protein
MDCCRHSSSRRRGRLKRCVDSRSCRSWTRRNGSIFYFASCTRHARRIGRSRDERLLSSFVVAIDELDPAADEFAAAAAAAAAVRDLTIAALRRRRTSDDVSESICVSLVHGTADDVAVPLPAALPIESMLAQLPNSDPCSSEKALKCGVDVEADGTPVDETDSVDDRFEYRKWRPSAVAVVAGSEIGSDDVDVDSAGDNGDVSGVTAIGTDEVSEWSRGFDQQAFESPPLLMTLWPTTTLLVAAADWHQAVPAPPVRGGDETGGRMASNRNVREAEELAADAERSDVD